VTSALQIIVTAPVVSFRDRLYDGVQAGLPCPPPSTVGGFLASAAGGWQRMPPATRFAMAFTARGAGTDLETYHPLDARGTASDPVPRERAFLADATLTIWLVSDLCGRGVRPRPRPSRRFARRPLLPWPRGLPETWPPHQIVGGRGYGGQEFELVFDHGFDFPCWSHMCSNNRHGTGHAYSRVSADPKPAGRSGLADRAKAADRRAHGWRHPPA